MDFANCESALKTDSFWGHSEYRPKGDHEKVDNDEKWKATIWNCDCDNPDKADIDETKQTATQEH